MFRLLCLLLPSAAAFSAEMTKDPDFPRFIQFVEEYGVRYRDEIEASGRFMAFKDNLVLIDARNSNDPKATHGVNQFSDLTPDEFRRKYLGLRAPTHKLPPKTFAAAANYSAATVDWRKKGAVSPIKNQGQCGSCWAFSATEQLESDYFIAFGQMKELSPQQIVSCDTKCYGCGGGNPINGWYYINGYGGQDSKASYPYVSGITGSTGTCSATTKAVEESIASNIGYIISESPTQESNMLKQIEESPMSICVDATLWQTYKSGVITTASNCGTSIDHAVQVVGYNAPGNYWIVRNSWGTTWGESGYIYVEAGSNVCGIASQAAITVASKPAMEDLVERD